MKTKELCQSSFYLAIFKCTLNDVRGDQGAKPLERIAAC